jgi:pSer/pThr/pTyr-binding forkhead associated (FHA) protein/TolA-binding protein
MLKLRIEDDEGNTTVVPLLRDEVTIGRKEGNTIRLTERNVSRQHARLLRESATLYVEDLGSYNGIRINGERIQGRAAVQPGDCIQIGDYLIALQREDEGAEPGRRADRSNGSTGAVAAGAGVDGEGEATAPVESPARDAGAGETRTEGTAVIRAKDVKPGARIDRTEVPRENAMRLCAVGEHFSGRVFALDKAPLVLGRTDDNDLVLPHRSVSRHHARVEYADGTWRIRDLKSANGTFVNGEEYAEVEIRAGDVVELGYVKLRLLGVDDDAGADAPLPEAVRRRKRRATSPLRAWALYVVVGVLLVAAGWIAWLLFGPGVQRADAPTAAPEAAVVAAGAGGADLEAAARLVAKGGGDEAQLFLDKARLEMKSEESYMGGERAAEQGDWDTAWDRFTSVGEESIFHARAVKRLPEVKRGYIQHHLAKAKEWETAGDMGRAVEEYRNVLFLDESNDEAIAGQKRLGRAGAAPAPGPVVPPAGGAARRPEGDARGLAGRQPATPTSDLPEVSAIDGEVPAVPPQGAAAPTTTTAPPATTGGDAPAAAAAPAAEPVDPGGSPRERAMRHYNSGNRLLLQNRFNAAIAAYEKAIQADPTFADVHRGLGIAYAKKGEHKLAARHYQQYIRLAPNNPDVPQVKRFLADYFRQFGE